MVDIFGRLSQEEMKDLANRCPDTFLEQGDVLYAPQDGAERLFILKQGRVQVYEVIRGGKEITLSVVEGGSVFGEIALTGQSLEGVYVRALAPSTVVSLRREDLEGLIMKKPEVGLRLVRELAERLHDSEVRYADILGKDVPARLATLILTLVESEGVVSSESYRIPTRYTHEQLGTMIGCKRVAVTRAFSRLKEDGAVELKGRHIVVKDLGYLEGLAKVRGERRVRVGSHVLCGRSGVGGDRCNLLVVRSAAVGASPLSERTSWNRQGEVRRTRYLRTPEKTTCTQVREKGASA